MKIQKSAMNICNCKETKKQTIELTLAEAETIANFFGAVDACSSDLKMTKEEEKVWEKLVKRIKKLSQKDS